MLEKFSTFDTIEVEFDMNIGTKEFMRGYNINCIEKDYNSCMFDRVVIGFNNNDCPSYLGSDLKVRLCRMVLVEKWDYKKQFAHDTSKILIGYD